MKILVASSFVPFVRGGDSALVADLVGALRERGHEVDTLLLPTTAHSEDVSEQMLALRLLDVTHAGDVLIALRTPSYALRHPNKVVWFIHHHRALYDLWGTDYQDMPDDSYGNRVREEAFRADDVYLREASRLFTNSQVVSDRLRRYNRLGSEVLYPPLGDPESYGCKGYGDFVFCPSRINLIKRQELLVEAMAHVHSRVRLVLAGSPDVEEHLERLQERIEALGVQDRVELIGSWISEERKRELFAQALACAYVPFDEDSYGYVTLEAFQSRKAVITCSDSGGTLELVQDGVNGFVVDPEPERLAEAMDALMAEPERARNLGEAAHRTLDELEISWDSVVERLVA